MLGVEAMVVVLILVIVSDKPCHVTLRLLRRQFAWKSLLLVMGARHPSTMGMAVKGMKGRMVVTVIAPVAVASVDMAFVTRTALVPAGTAKAKALASRRKRRPRDASQALPALLLRLPLLERPPEQIGKRRLNKLKIG